jgi:murein DD-endopeptidase MepM/ murein hydrolase activator NlpD
MFTPRRTKLAVLVASVGLVLSTAACGGSGSTVAKADVPVPIGNQASATPTPSVAASPKPSPTKSPTTGTASTTRTTKFVFPVVGNVSYAHVHHDYPATDIMAKCGSEVRATTSGLVLSVTRVDKWKASVNAGATRGGLSVSIKGDDGVRYYGSHLEAIAKYIEPGVRVAAGQELGKVGQTGDASACHLHFGISPVCKGDGDWWIQRGVIWPWKYLDSWRTGGDKSPVAEINAWKSKHGCPTHALVDP